jgi:myo-inositol-1(or 4)-monophosphatase
VSKLLQTAVKAARLSGELISNSLGTLSRDDITAKKASDFVTRVDKESEDIIIKTISSTFPKHTFLAEESLNETSSGEYIWIIDPLDGTTNYIHEFPLFSVSIGLEHNGKMILGVILDPLRDELFTAEKGKGAYLNNHPIKASAVIELKESLLTTGFPFRRKDLIDPYLKLFKSLFNKISDMRRGGSAALDLAYLASGRCDGFFEIGLSPWDIAAGSILIKEAGGIISDFGGGEDYLITGNIVAGNPYLHARILTEVKAMLAGIIEK